MGGTGDATAPAEASADATSASDATSSLDGAAADATVETMDATSASDGSGPSVDGADGSSGGASPDGAAASVDAAAGGDSCGADSGLDSGAASCPTQTSTVLGIHVALPVAWPAMLASSAGSGVVDLWYLVAADGGLTFTGTGITCGVNLPTTILNGTGQASVCASGSDAACPGEVQIAFDYAEWDTDITRTFALSGSQTGWSAGATLSTDPAMVLLGLTNASYGAASAAWPSYCSTNCIPSSDASSAPTCSAGTCAGPDGPFPGSDITDDDGDGFPGITANPLSSSTYTLPPTAVSAFATPPLADQVYMALRAQVALSATMMSCTTGSGTATVTLFDTHVVGCHAAVTSTNGGVSYAGPPGPCISSQVAFLDQNRVVYGPTASSVASASTPITGTVTVQQVSAGATCADVRAIQ
jgi:hypothetical protein